MKSLLAIQFIGVPDSVSQSSSERAKRETNTAKKYSNGQLIDTSFYGPVIIRN